jgi:hypothetical protein
MTDDFRIAELEKDVAQLQEDCKVIPVLAEQIVSLRRENGELRDDGKAIRNWLIGFCISLALAAIGMAITLSQIIPGGPS